MSLMRIPTMLVLLVIILSIAFVVIGSIVKNIRSGSRKTAIIKIGIIAAVILGGRILLNFSTAGNLPVPMGNKYNQNYVINLDKVQVSNSGTKVKINKALLDLKQVSLTMGVKGKDKLVALELKKNPDDEKPLQKMKGQWLGNRWSYEYNGYGMPYDEDYFIDPLYLVCYLSNGEELTFEIQDVKDVKSKTEFTKINKTIENEGRKLTIESITRAMNYTNVSATSVGRFGEMEASIIYNNVESEKTSPSWSGGGSNYNYGFSFKPIEGGSITIKITMKDSDKVYLIEVK
jgi:hypothetical protein